MSSSARMRRYRVAIAGSLALALAAGCASPTTPGGTGGGDRRTSGGSIGTGVAATGGTKADPGTAGAGGATGQGTGTGQAGTAGTGGTEPSGVRPAGSTRAPVDPKVFLVGRVLVPPGILSNNGGNVIGQNGGNVIGQNGGNVIGQNGGNIVSNNGGSVIGQNGGNVIGQNGGNVIGQNGGNVIGQNGGNVIGQNGGNVIGQNGGNVIGQNGGNIISNNGGSFRLGQRPLAYASIRVADAAGKPRLDKAGNEVVVQADEEGQYVLPRDVVTANSILRVTSPAIQGEVTAFVARGGEGVEQMDVDAVSTLTSTYILEKFVKGKQDVLDRLTRDIEAEAREDVTKALEATGGEAVGSLAPLALVSSVDSLIGRDANVADVIKRIEKLLILVGLVNQGDGMQALDVPLTLTQGILADRDGVYLFSQFDHTLYRANFDGLLKLVVPPGSWPYAEPKVDHVKSFNSGMSIREGWLYLCDTYAHRIVRIRDGIVETIVGTGEEGSSVDGIDAKSAKISHPTGLAIAEDGTIYFSEAGNNIVKKVSGEGTLVTVAKSGKTKSGSELALSRPQGLALDMDGNLLIADQGNDLIRRFLPSTGELQAMNSKVPTFIEPAAITMLGDKMIVTAAAPQVFEMGADGSLVEEVRTTDPRHAGTGVQWLSTPAGVSSFEDRLYVQSRSQVLLEISAAAGRPVREIAGISVRQTASTLVNALCFDVNSAGSIVIADSGNNRVFLRRPDGTLDVIAGNGKRAFTRESSQARDVSIGRVFKIKWASSNEVLMVVDGGSSMTIQRLNLDGRLNTLAGNGMPFLGNATSGPATEIALPDIAGIISLTDKQSLLMYKGELRFDLLSDGMISGYLDWPANEGGVRGVRQNTSGVTYFDYKNMSLLLVTGNSTSVLMGRDETRLAVSNEGPLGDVLYVGTAFDGELVYLATMTSVYQKNMKTGRVRKLAGPGGSVLNSDARDSSLRDVVDVAISPSGDLLILESNQLKVVPKSML